MIVVAPPSKSITHRALICAALAEGTSTIINPLLCDDTEATLQGLKQLGIRIEQSPDRWIIHGGAFQTPQTPKEKIFCNESGTTLRFLMALTRLLEIPSEFSGKPSLLQRPMTPLIEALKNVSETITIKGDMSSQFLSGLLLAAPARKKATTIKLSTPLVSKPYVDLTLEVQKAFGVSIEADHNFSTFHIAPQTYKPCVFTVEGDWSSASFFIAAGALYKKVTLTGLNPNSIQADRQIETILKKMGGKFFWEKDRLTVAPSPLKGIEWDFTDAPDLFPIVSVLCAHAETESRLKGLSNLKFKESDRIKEMENVFNNSGKLNSKDHRIIMAAAINDLATKSKTAFEYPNAVAKSFPDFWTELKKLVR